MAVATLEDVDLGVMDLRINMVVHSPILGTKMFGTEVGSVKVHQPVGCFNAYKVGARLALNSQWKIRIVFLAVSPLTEGLGLVKLGPRRSSSTALVVLMLTAPRICPPAYS